MKSCVQWLLPWITRVYEKDLKMMLSTQNVYPRTANRDNLGILRLEVLVQGKMAIMYRFFTKCGNSETC
jgi:hypothetical protein